MPFFIEASGIDPQSKSLVGLRVERDMEIGEQLPIFLRPPPRQGTRPRMAHRACTANVVGRDVSFVLYPVLSVVHDWFRLFGRQPVISREVLQDRTAFL